jgi:hypothetical protein
MYYAAELLNGVWHDVGNEVNLGPVQQRFYTPPKNSLVSHVDLGDWVSTTAIQIQDHFLVLDIPTTDAHWEDTTAILQFTNGFLRVVN